MTYCVDHVKLVEDVAIIKTTALALDKRINGSIDEIQKHIEHGTAWRVAIIGVFAMMMIQILILSSMWGRLCKTVEVNTVRLNDLEEIHPRGK